MTTDRLSVCMFPTGISYVDRSRERDGDYVRIAFLPFATLALEWTRARTPADLRAAVEAHAATLAARRGERYQVSVCGHTVAKARAWAASSPGSPRGRSRATGSPPTVARRSRSSRALVAAYSGATSLGRAGTRTST